MTIKNLLLVLLVFFTHSVQSQKKEYSTHLIADSLKENANAVIRVDEMNIIIESQQKMKLVTKRVTTVLNEKGLESLNAEEFYDKTTIVSKIEAIVYDAFGNEIKKIKRKDFRDLIAGGEGTMATDSRIIYLNYTPIQYPFTLEYSSEVITSNTAIIPTWYFVSDYNVSVEKCILSVNYLSDLGFKTKEFNFEGYDIKKTVLDNKVVYSTQNIKALKYEDLSPSGYLIFPKLMMGLDSFNLEGVDGYAKTWKEFGQWFNDKILPGTDELTPEAIAKVKNLVGDEKDPIQKAKIIYNYLQGKSRYVSIQLGIGGFRPMLAKDVDRLGYGDCKALSNYTYAMLKAVDVPSYHTILYGSNAKNNLQSDFVSVQGNHMILAVPNGEKYIFLECTSQDAPFGYQANFTDDREVLIIKPDGGEMVWTKKYENKDNSKISKGSYTILDNGNLLGKISVISEGSQYEKSGLENLQPVEKEAYLKKYWANINSLKINTTTFINDKEKVSFTANSEISATNYGNLSGNKMMFVLNAYNQYLGNVKRFRNRKTPFEIQRGSFDNDDIEIELPSTFLVEFLPSNFEVKSKFGEYKTELIKKDNTHIVYKRSFLLKKGLYSNTDYDDFRLFMDQVSRNDNAKIILTKI